MLFKQMLIGEFKSPLGDKNRIALPKVLREQLDKEVVLTRGYERSLIILDANRWQKLISNINQGSLLNLSVRDTKRFLLGGAYQITLDKQGRFVIPEALVEYANLEANVSFIGVGEWIEIWDEDAWEQKLNYLSQNSADIADKL